MNSTPRAWRGSPDTSTTSFVLELYCELLGWPLHKLHCLCEFASLVLFWEKRHSATTSTGVSLLSAYVDVADLLLNTGSPSSQSCKPRQADGLNQLL